MDICDKCGDQISTLEPCFKLSYGFQNPDSSFFLDSHIMLHLDCLSDDNVYRIIIDKIKKN